MKEIIEILDNYGDMKITEEHALECSKNVTIDGGMDTLDRGHILEYFAIYITGMKWPTYGDTKEFNDKFNALMVANAPLKGIVLGSLWDVPIYEGN